MTTAAVFKVQLFLRIFFLGRLPTLPFQGLVCEEVYFLSEAKATSFASVLLRLSKSFPLVKGQFFSL